MQDEQRIKPANIENIVATNQGKRPLTMDPPVAKPLSVTAVAKLRTEDHIIVDTRSSGEFGAGHIPNAYNIQLSSDEFEQRIGWVTPHDVPIILVTGKDGEAQTAVHKMAFVALDSRVVGYLKGGLPAWMNAGGSVATVAQIDVKTLHHRLSVNGIQVLDVRDSEEWEEGHVENGVHMNFKVMSDQIQNLPLTTEQSIAITCATGKRSSTAASILLRHGYKKLYNVTGGMVAWEAAKLPMLDGEGNVCKI